LLLPENKIIAVKKKGSSGQIEAIGLLPSQISAASMVLTTAGRLFPRTITRCIPILTTTTITEARPPGSTTTTTTAADLDLAPGGGREGGTTTVGGRPTGLTVLGKVLMEGMRATGMGEEGMAMDARPEACPPEDIRTILPTTEAGVGTDPLPLLITTMHMGTGMVLRLGLVATVKGGMKHVTTRTTMVWNAQCSTPPLPTTEAHPLPTTGAGLLQGQEDPMALTWAGLPGGQACTTTDTVTGQGALGGEGHRPRMGWGRPEGPRPRRMMRAPGDDLSGNGITVEAAVGTTAGQAGLTAHPLLVTTGLHPPWEGPGLGGLTRCRRSCPEKRAGLHSRMTGVWIPAVPVPGCQSAG